MRRNSPLGALLLMLPLMWPQTFGAAQKSHSLLEGSQSTPSVKRETQQKQPLQPEDKQDEVIRLESNLVNVYARAVDRDGKGVAGLRREDFHLFEDGVEQKIEHFGPVEDPFTIALVINVSGSMSSRLKEVQEAAAAFIDLLRPDDRAMLVSFDPYEHILIEATGDKEKLKKAISKIKSHGSPNLFQGIHHLLAGRLQPIAGRKAILLFSDGIDHKSFYGTYEDTILLAERGDALIYPIQHDSIVRNDPKLAQDAIRQYKLAAADAYARDLAQKTGGRLFRIEREQPLKQAFESVAQGLHQQYSLGYYPKKRPEPGERRMINVSLQQANLVAITRSYYAPDQTTGSPEQWGNLSRQSTSSILNEEEKRRWKDIPPMYSGRRHESMGIMMSGQYSISFFSGEIGARLSNVILRDVNGEDYISALIHIDPATLTFTKEADGWESAAADVFAANFEGAFPNGAVTAAVKLRERGDRLSELMKYGKSINLNIPLKHIYFSPMRQMRVIVRDAKSQKSSYVSQFVSIPPKGYFLHASGVMLSEEPSLNVENLLATFSGLDGSASQASPAARRFRSGATLNYSYHVYDAKPYSSNGHKHLVEQAHLERRGKPTLLIVFDELDMTEQKGKKRMLVKGSLKLKPEMSAGWYVLRITVSDENPEKDGFYPKAVQWVDFQVIE